MQYRLGTCGSCQARFKIPASFTPTRARCRRCSGVVAIGPLVSDSRSGAESTPRPSTESRPRAPVASPVPATKIEDVVARPRDARADLEPVSREARAAEPLEIVRAPGSLPVRETPPAPAPAAVAAAPRAPRPERPPAIERSPVQAKARSKPAKKRWIPAVVAVIVLALAAAGLWAMKDSGVVTETRAAPEAGSQATRVDPAADHESADAKPVEQQGASDEHGARGN